MALARVARTTGDGTSETSEITTARGGRPAKPRGRRRAPTIVLAALTSLALAAGFAPAVFAVETITLTTPFPAISVAPGDDVTFNLAVDTDVAGRVDLEVSGTPQGWTAVLRGGGFVVDGVQTTGAEPTEVQLDVGVPEEAAEGEQTITVTATSDGVTATLPLDITVAAAAAGEVTLETDVAQLRGAVDDTFTFDLTLSNDTAAELTYSVAGQGPPGWQVEPTISGQTQAASATLEAGGEATINTTVTPPPDQAAGTFPVVVAVTAGDQQYPAELQVEITGSYSMQLSTPDERLNTSGEAGQVIEQSVVVTNDGTSPLENVRITGTGPTGWEVEEATVDPIAPGQTGQAVVRITPSSSAIAGDYNVTLRAENEEANAEAIIRVTIETSLLWGVLAVVLILAVLGGLFWVFRTYGRR